MAQSSSSSFTVKIQPRPVLSTSFKLTSAVGGTSLPFTLGHAFRKGEVPAGANVACSIPDFQVVGKNWWPDGSLKFAVISGRAALTAGTPLTVNLTTGTPAGGAILTTTDLKATGITALVTTSAFGSASWNGTDWDAPFMTWISGPIMSSWIYRKQVGSDAHLVAWLEVRLYAGGAVEVLPWIENGYLNVAGPTNKNTTYSFSLGGTERFSADVDLPNHCRTVLISDSGLSYWFGTDPRVIPKHDTAYMQNTLLVPSYGAVVSSTAKIWSRIAQTYSPSQQGNFPSAMGATGYHPSIGLLPEWDVLYLSTQDNRAYAGVVVNGYYAGRYGIHYRDENTNRPIRFSSYPNLVLSSTSIDGIKDTGGSTTNSYTPTPTGTTPPQWASSHHPSVGFMAYLLTGRFYFMEEVQFAATLHFLKNSNHLREFSNGVFLTNAGANQPRGAAWSIRTLAQAACITPDSDTTLRNELISSLEHNVNYYHSKYVATPNNPFGFLDPGGDYLVRGSILAGSTTTVVKLGGNDLLSATPDHYVGWTLAIGGESRPIIAYDPVNKTATVSPAFSSTPATSYPWVLNEGIYFTAGWQEDFFTASCGYAINLDPGISSTGKAKFFQFFNWKARSVIGRLGGTGPTEYLYRDAATYNLAVAPSDSPDFFGGKGPWYDNWGQIYKATVGTTNSGVAGDLRGGNFPDPTSYWGNLQPALAYAVDQNVPGAVDAYNRMTGASNFRQLVVGWNESPVWSVKPRNS